MPLLVLECEYILFSPCQFIFAATLTYLCVIESKRSRK